MRLQKDGTLSFEGWGKGPNLLESYFTINNLTNTNANKNMIRYKRNLSISYVQSRYTALVVYAKVGTMRLHFYDLLLYLVKTSIASSSQSLPARDSAEHARPHSCWFSAPSSWRSLQMARRTSLLAAAGLRSSARWKSNSASFIFPAAWWALERSC